MRRFKNISFVHTIFTKRQSLILLFSLSLLFVNFANASPNTITFQSRIVKPDGAALEAASVNFRFSITDTVGSCVIYQEDFSNRNMTGSKGLINLAIGSGSKVYPVAAMPLTEVFNNYNSPTLNCQAGGNITAGVTDRRKLIVQFNDGSGWQTVPAMDINSNPYALQADSAHKLGDFPAADYLRLATIATAATCIGGQALHFNGASFTCVAVGVGSGTVASVSSANADIGVSMASPTPVLTLNSGTGANQIVKLNGTSQLPAVSGVNLTALNASNLGSGTVPAAQMPALTGDVTMTAGTTATSIANSAVTNTHVAAGAAIARSKLATGSMNQVIVNDGTSGALSSIGCANGELIKWAAGVPTCSTDVAGVGDIINGGNATGATVSVGTTDAQSFVLKTNNATAMTILSNGNVGVGATTPATKLDVAGGVKIGTEATACAAGLAGTLRYNATSIEFCNGSAWQAFGVSGAGFTSLGGQTGSAQTFANGSSGTEPAFSSATNTHTLNIPLASGVGVTSGTISKADYDSFAAKQAALGYTPLNPANNLSDVANVGTARTNLGLGTAAVLNVGTGNNNIVQLNGTAQLPAVDGSLLTGITSGQIPNLDAAKITSGTIAGARMPALTGDVTMGAGTTTTAIAGLARSKLASGTNNHVLINDGAGVMSSEANLAVSRGGTGAGSFAANQIVGTNGTGSALTSFTCALNQIIKFDVTGNATCGTDLGSGAFVDGGNTFAATATIGTNSNDNLEIETNGTTKMTVLANGNVGVGTTSPSSKLEVASDAATGLNVSTYEGSASWNSSVLSLRRATGTAAAPGVVNSGNEFGRVDFFGRTSSGWALGGQIKSYNTSAAGGSTLNGALEFLTGAIGSSTPISRMLINSTGNVGIGTASPTSILHTVASGAKTAAFTGNLLSTTATSSTASINKIGVDVQSTGTWNGATAINTGLNVNVSGGTTNYAAIFQGGNVGIGTTAPAYTLDVNGPINFTKLFSGAQSAASPGFGIGHSDGQAYSGIVNVLQGSADTIGGIHSQVYANATSIDRYAYIASSKPSGSGTFSAHASGDYLSGIGFAGQTTTAPSSGMAIGASIIPKVDAAVSSQVLPTALTFNTSVTNNAGLTERMRITSTGNVGIGTTSPQTTLQVAGVISPATNNTYTLGNATYRFTEVYATNGVINTSDRREKKDIYNTDLGLDFINKLRPVSYRWNTGVDNDVHYGLIAQEAEQVIAEVGKTEKTSIVTHDETTDRYGVRYSELISPLIKAVQELYNRLMGVEGDVTALKAKDAVKDREIASVKADNAQLKLNDEAKAKEIEKLKQENAAIKAYLCGKDKKAPICK